MNDAALVLIDIQNDYFPGGRMELDGPEKAAEGAAQVLGAFRRQGLPVFHIRHESVFPGGGFMLPGTSGADIHPLVAPAEGEAVITKHYPSAFRETGLAETLKEQGIVHLVFAGMMTHMCIDTSVRAAFDLGFRCTMLKDATATRELSLDGETVPAVHVQNAFIAALSQFFATVVDIRTFLAGGRDQ